MRIACGLLAGLCWLFDAAAFLGLLFVVFKPRALDSDLYPAMGLYALSVVLGLASLICGLLARRQAAAPDPLLSATLIAAFLGLLLPALLVLAIARA